MARDRREEALSRLHTVLKTIEGLAEDPYNDGAPCAFRNRDGLPDERLPAIVLMDADEEADLEARNRNRDARSPNLVIMKPEIYFQVKPSKPDNASIGQDVNAFRVKILKAVMSDSTLKDILGTNGEIFYAGCGTDLARNQPLKGQVGVAFWLRYALIPGEL